MQKPYKIICENKECKKEFVINQNEYSRKYCTKECRKHAFNALYYKTHYIKNKQKQLDVVKKTPSEFEELNKCFAFDGADTY